LKKIIPWRIRNKIFEGFHLLYHLLINMGVKHNSAENWDNALEREWDSSQRNWPTKNALVDTLTEADEFILDVGCGNGSLLRHLKGSGYANLGKGIIFVPDNCLGPISEPSHVAMYTAGTLEKLLSRKFDILKIESFHDENFEMPILFAYIEKPV